MAIVDGHIRCGVCSELKPVGDFAPSFARAGNGRCRPCARRVAVGGREWRRTASPEDLERHRKYSSAKYQSRRGRLLAGMRARRLVVSYGITESEYDALLVAQDGLCACCGEPTSPDGSRLAVDHDHRTGAVRGLICRPCNLGIGSLGDTTDGVRRALSYLERAAQRRGSDG